MGGGSILSVMDAAFSRRGWSTLRQAGRQNSHSARRAPSIIHNGVPLTNKPLKRIDLWAQKMAKDKGGSHGSLESVALRVFFQISERWGLDEDQQRVLLGCADPAAFQQWKQGRFTDVAPEILVRVSHVLGIYKALHTIFSDETQANAWLHRKNDAPLFRGETALTVLLDGQGEGLEHVRGYLEAQLA